MRIAVPREDAGAEKRVTLVPESVKRLAAKQISTSIEAGAGVRARVSDEEYKAAGGTIETSREALFAGADFYEKHRNDWHTQEALLASAKHKVAHLYARWAELEGIKAGK